MSALPVKKDTYIILLNHIKQEITEGLDRAQKAYNREKVITYWKIGQAIVKHLLENKNRADYGKQLYKKLSQDLDIGERLLYQISQFYNTYPDFKPSQNLKWSHYRLLTSVKDEGQRNILEAKASDDNWSKRDLENFLKAEKAKSNKFSKPKARKPKKLSVSKGKLYTYRLFRDDYADNILIDCGFNIYKESEITKFKGTFAKIVKIKNNYKLVASKVTSKHLYTYKAYIKKIIDGDTLWVNIDCGFRIWVKQKIRLWGINAPGIIMQKGIKAYKFVCKELKDLPFIIIKSHGRDKYDRYLTDIFYLKGEEDPFVVLEKGAFLNQRLLDENLAVRE
jgi:endonuclease YncB( thermonuclease family)